MDYQNYKPHPGVAAVLSFLFTGLGQIYIGKIKKGLMMMFFSSLGMLLTILGAVVLGNCLLAKITGISLLILGSLFFLLGIILICLLGVISIRSAFREALEFKL